MNEYSLRDHEGLEVGKPGADPTGRDVEAVSHEKEVLYGTAEPESWHVAGQQHPGFDEQEKQVFTSDH